MNSIVRNSIWYWTMVATLFSVTTAVRVYGLDTPPLEFHPVKQYRSALTARAFYYGTLDSVPTWRMEVANETLGEIGILGPPVVDAIAVALYRTLGQEALWAPRLISALAWVIGGIFLFLLARRLVSADGSLVAAGFYLLLPFGVVASQSFQPDPLMVMFMVATLYFVALDDEAPSWRRLLLAAAAGGMAILIKPVSLFLIFGAVAALSLHRRDSWNSRVFIRHGIFLAITLMPAVIYYGHAILISGSLSHQAQKSFIPQLLLEPTFWDGWVKRVRIVMGFTYPILGLCGALLLPERRSRYLVGGLWAGYIVMCFAFTYTISTHDYYHLPLVPVVALGVGAIVAVVLDQFNRSVGGPASRVGVVTLLVLAAFLSAGTSIQARRRVPSYEADLRLARDIGARVGHSTRTIHLAPYDGKPLMYYGELSGPYWPYWYDIRDEPLWGVEPMTVEERFARLNAKTPADYFLVTDLQEFATQHDLQEFLTRNFSKLAESEEYVIFDVRGR